MAHIRVEFLTLTVITFSPVFVFMSFEHLLIDEHFLSTYRFGIKSLERSLVKNDGLSFSNWIVRRFSNR